MARYEHLRLLRLQELERRKHGFGKPYARDRGAHSTKLKSELDAAIDTQRRRRRPAAIKPSLILRVQMKGALLEEEWERLDLTVLSSDGDRTLVLFSSSDDMQKLRDRLDAYAGAIPEDQKSAAYEAFVSAVESIGSVEPRDRIGTQLREEGFSGLADFADDQHKLLDLELWDLGTRLLRENKMDEIAEVVEEAGGEVVDRYVGPSITMLRVRAAGLLIRALLAIEEVASIDLPPEPDIVTAELLDRTLGDLPLCNALDETAPVIGVIDSGVNAHPLIEDVLIGAIGVPESMGYADGWGHGTRVAGVAVFGDLRAQLAGASELQRGARLCSAKVVNDQGRFDDRTLVPSQMSRAVRTLHERFGCRLFVIALGDRKRPYKGGKVGAWAATLDELVRELNIVIFVSAGNREQPRSGDLIEQAVTDYPHYLTENENRFYEPAGAMNVITVGSLAHGEGLDEARGGDVRVRPITRQLEPSPFTRIGPGLGGAVKPDVVDFGGTVVFDPYTLQLLDGLKLPSAGLLTLHHRPMESLFRSGSGTSYATPLVAFKASQILRRFPTASANLVRALLVGAAEVPEQALERLKLLGAEATHAICGHGRVDVERAAFSDDARVVLYVEDALPLDHFAVYEIPIPDLFQSEEGRRTVRITLAFDPPVRHTRIDYAGVTMSFRLKRGCDPQLIFDHYRKRTKEEGRQPAMPNRCDCPLRPGPNFRERGTLQTACAEFQRDIAKYGDRYYLVVRCEAGWAASFVEQQRFAIVVELEHEAEIALYERVRVRLNA